MRDPLHHEDFEDYLQQEVNQHRIYPSDHIWRNIQYELHGYKKWPALTVVTIFIISALVVSTILIKPTPEIFTSAYNIALQKKALTTNDISDEQTEIASTKVLAENLSTENITRKTIEAALSKIDVTDSDRFDQPINELLADNINITPINNQSTISSPNQPHTIENDKLIAVTTNEAFLQSSIINDYSSATQQSSNNTSVKASVPIANFSNSTHKGSHLSDMNDKAFNFLDQYVTTRKNKQWLKHFDWQIYATPSVSDRRLVDDNMHNKNSHNYISGMPYPAGYTIDANHVVQHKPSIGYELGVGVGYKLSDRLHLRTGLQFNIRQYEIHAYAFGVENTSIPIGTSGTDSLNTTSNFRSVQASYPETSTPVTLVNKYYEISIPLGIDWTAIKFNKHLSLGIATAVQPTYTFDKQPFIITSNYKNYADGSQLMRNWNINANVETYLGYQTGSYRWQLGPQFRYQLLPTFSSAYPIKEYLFDYGVKIGVVKSFR
jgi:hypothetical protein